MRTQYLTLGMTLLMLTGAVVTADAKTLQTHCKGGGTFTSGVETNIDTNGDGQSAGLEQGASVCNIGSFVFQQETEYVQRPVSSACPKGTTDEFYIDATHGQDRSVSTDEDTGDQLFGKITSATLCINFSSFPTPPFPFTVSGQQEAIGGTGKYTSATGSGSFHTVGNYLAFGCKGACPGPPFPVGGFGQFTVTTDGTLTLPNSDHDNGGHGKDD